MENISKNAKQKNVFLSFCSARAGTYNEAACLSQNRVFVCRNYPNLPYISLHHYVPRGSTDQFRETVEVVASTICDLPVADSLERIYDNFVPRLRSHQCFIPAQGICYEIYPRAEAPESTNPVFAAPLAGAEEHCRYLGPGEFSALLFCPRVNKKPYVCLLPEVGVLRTVKHYYARPVDPALNVDRSMRVMEMVDLEDRQRRECEAEGGRWRENGL